MALRRRDAVRIMYGTGAGVHTAIVKGGQVTPHHQDPVTAATMATSAAAGSRGQARLTR